MPQNKKFRRTAVIIVGLVFILLGLGFAKTGLPLHKSWLIACALPVLALLRQKGILTIAAISICCFTIGWYRGSGVSEKLRMYESLYSQKIIVTGIAQTDGVYSNSSQLSFNLGRLEIVEPTDKQLIGAILVEGYGDPAVYRGDVVQAEGKLYPRRGSLQGQMKFADIQVVGRSDSFIETSRRDFVAGMQSALPEPHASFGLGLLVGQRNTLPDVVNDNLAAVGLTHLIAVSGYNLTILVRSARRLFGKRSKFQTTVLSCLLICLFLLYTGLSPSIVRAAIVSGISLVAWYYGRVVRPLLLILLAASITASVNPLYIWSDIGWYLSFLAFYGVLIVAPLLSRTLFKKEPKELVNIMIESFAAQAMTLPYILFIFGKFSVVSFLANILIVPLLPFAMMFSMMAGIAGVFAPQIAGWPAYPAKLLLTYMLDVINLLSRIPGIYRSVRLSLLQMILLYVFIAIVTVRLWRKVTNRRDTITDINQEFLS